MPTDDDVDVIVDREGARYEPGCRKVRYEHELTARAVLLECWAAASHGNDRRRERYHYACDRCGGWHLTSQDPPEEKRRR